MSLWSALRGWWHGCEFPDAPAITTYLECEKRGYEMRPCLCPTLEANYGFFENGDFGNLDTGEVLSSTRSLPPDLSEAADEYVRK